MVHNQTTKVNKMEGVPKNKATQCANIIRDAILKGEWGKRLPGERTLAKELMVSRACLRQALEILSVEQILAPAEKSKQRLILKQPQVPQSSKKVIFLTPEPAHRAPPLVLEHIAQLRYHLSKENMTIELLASRIFKNSQTSASTMSQLTSEHHDAHWILHQCPEHIQRWFSKQPIKSIVLGSLFPSVKLPSIGIDFYSASRHATGHLLAKGHRRIGFIRFRSELAGDNQAIDGMKAAMDAHGSEIPLPKPIILSHNFHLERLVNTLDQVCSSENRPTALIIVNHHHYITTFSHLLSKGIRIPQDISLIGLSHDKVLDCFSPKPTCYSVGERLIHDLTKMILNPKSKALQKPTLLIPNIIKGKTVTDCQSTDNSSRDY
jgi:DNA-binding LacI/PurR family transcriptional regulator